MKKTAAMGLGALAAASLAFAAKDPVIMTVGGIDVPRSEFEYLYNKNSQQQINPQTIDEYVEMFKLYKMKVADARAEGIDTTAAFLKEIDTHRHDLAAPYMADSVLIHKLVHEAWERSNEEVEARHIMLFKTRDPKQNAVLRQRADSLHGVLASGGNFETLVAEYSQDKGSNGKGGSMGWIIAGNLPYAFEQAAFSLCENEISDVVETPMGYHILKGGKHRPARGKVQVQHILKLTQNKSEADKARAKAEIDSLYVLAVSNPEAFSVLAQNNSEDRGSARQGGSLPLFGAGEMVAEFDSVSFALADGEISRPFATAYGYHIVKRIKGQPTPSEAQIRPRIMQQISNSNDPRHTQLRDAQSKSLARKHKVSVNRKNMEALEADARANGIDSLFVDKYINLALPLFTVGKKKFTTADYASGLSKVEVPAGILAAQAVAEQLAAQYNAALVAAEEERLLAVQPDYRNLLKEYEDGSLLYEVSVQKVWDRAAKDTEGLEQYFDEHRNNYNWTEPRAKGYLVQAANDSVAALVRERAAGLADADMVKTIRDEFKGQALIDRVLVSKGTNPMVDFLLFGGPAYTAPSTKYPEYFMINARLITVPEEVSDVKGLVTSDYQNEFQARWEDELRSKYPATVYPKVLRTVKPVRAAAPQTTETDK